MRNKIKYFLIAGILFCFSVSALTGCTGREDVVLKTDTSDWQETGGLTDNGAGGSYGDESDGLPQTVCEEQDAGPTVIYVHICGAVVNPGVYELTSESRVFEGIAAAGGFCEDACEDYVNQAGQLQDGQRLVIPTIEEVEAAKEEGGYGELWQLPTDDAGQGSAAASKTADGLVNINTASESELGEISGIGAGKAAAIVKYRQENGSFASIEDIMKVSGIKEGTYEKIKDKITVD